MSIPPSPHLSAGVSSARTPGTPSTHIHTVPPHRWVNTACHIIGSFGINLFFGVYAVKISLRLTSFHLFSSLNWGGSELGVLTRTFPIFPVSLCLQINVQALCSCLNSFTCQCTLFTPVFIYLFIYLFIYGDLLLRL